MSLIMGQIEPEHLELFACEFGKIAESDCLHSNIYKYQPISIKLGQIICDHKISDAFVMDLIGQELLELSALEF